MTSTVIQQSEALDLEDTAVARKEHEASDRELVARLVGQARADLSWLNLVRTFGAADPLEGVA
ncbi:hypothetical protein OHB01_35650 [Microbispora hainanensis]|uniref:hypothetical protein n=1 Tax=Microbispora hainanensis TaxID=568844 RepID=UPI002E2A69B4|nr:hypothetical protein [Microbispora hainanensis]